MALCRLRLLVIIFILTLWSSGCRAQNLEAAALIEAMNSWSNGPAKLGKSWVRDNPCQQWEGVTCNERGQVTKLKLTDLALKGPLPSLRNLPELETLELDNNNFTGPIPVDYGSLSKLRNLTLSRNLLEGEIPQQLGSLTNLTNLFLEHNVRLRGMIPASFGLLKNLEYLYLGNTSISGQLPAALGDMENLVVISIWGLPLEGGLPPELGKLRRLRYINAHDSFLRGNLPREFQNLTVLNRLLLYNNDFYGGIPEEWGNMVALTELQLRDNRFTGPVPASFGNLKNLSELTLQRNQFTGEIPTSLTNVTTLRQLRIGSNYFIGGLPSFQSGVIEVRWFVDNCLNSSQGQRDKGSCDQFYGSLTDGCAPCPEGTFWSTPKPCRCRAPLQIEITFPVLSSAAFNTSLFSANVSTYLGLTANEVVNVQPNPVGNGLHVTFWIVPQQGDALRDNIAEEYVSRFRSGLVNTVPGAGYTFVNSTLPSAWRQFDRRLFDGSWRDPDSTYVNHTEKEGTKLMPIVIGTVVGVMAALVAVGVIIWVMKKPKQRQDVTKTTATTRQTGTHSSFHSFQTGSSTGGPGGGVAVTTARVFHSEDLAAACNNFAKANEIGVGGHARVYRGNIPGIGPVAVKRAKLRAVQGREFKNELDVLSRVHHRNLVRFLGCCEEEDEQILVYEYMSNGTLYTHLAGRAKAPLDWHQRLDIAIGTATGLTYLHNHADPPIIHRDIKPSNILLDENMKAKLGDFGISRMLDDPAESTVFTRVAGTMGYLDPMYHETRSLTDKSDVYSFGVVLLELVSGKDPSGRRGPLPGMTMVEWVETQYTKDGLEGIVDPVLNGRYPYDTMCRIVELGLWCTRPTWNQRPTMKEVLSALEVAKKIAEKEAGSEDGTTTEAVFGKHMHVNVRGKKHDPKGTGKGGRLFSEEQLLEDPNTEGQPSFSIDTMPEMETKLEAR